MTSDPWEKAHVYGLPWSAIDIRGVAHLVDERSFAQDALCNVSVVRLNHTPNPYPVCKRCLRTKRAKELGL